VLVEGVGEIVAGVGGSGLLEVRVVEIELGGVVEGLAGGFAEEGVGGLVGPLFLGGEDLRGFADTVPGFPSGFPEIGDEDSGCLSD
jgi:hypothetical protein